MRPRGGGRGGGACAERVERWRLRQKSVDAEGKLAPSVYRAVFARSRPAYYGSRHWSRRSRAQLELTAFCEVERCGATARPACSPPQLRRARRGAARARPDHALRGLPPPRAQARGGARAAGRRETSCATSIRSGRSTTAAAIAALKAKHRRPLRRSDLEQPRRAFDLATPFVFGLVLAGGEGKRLAPLTADRAKPAVPFGGNYRLIDFALSNLVNAGYLQIVVLTQYKSHTLDRHISTTWRLSPLLGNYVTAVPAQMRRGPHWFAGSADAIYQNLNLLYDERPDYVCVFGADHIYRMDPRQMVDQHIESGAGVTVAGIRVPIEQASEFGVIEAGDGRAHDPRLPREADRSRRARRRTRPGLRLDGQLRLHAPTCSSTPSPPTPPTRPPPRYRRRHHPGAGRPRRGSGLRLHGQRRARRDRARSQLLARRRNPRRLLRRAHGSHLGRPGLQPLQPRVADPHLAGVPAAGEVRVPGRGPDGTRARLDGVRRRDRVRGRRCAARFSRPGCTCTPRSEVEGSILLHGVDVGRGAVVRNAIVDKNVRIAAGAQIGVDLEADRERFVVSPGGIVVIAKGETVDALTRGSRCSRASTRPRSTAAPASTSSISRASSPVSRM